MAYKKYILHNVPLHGITNKTWICIEQLMKMWPEARRSLTVSPRSSGSVFANSVSMATLQKATT